MTIETRERWDGPTQTWIDEYFDEDTGAWEAMDREVFDAATRTWRDEHRVAGGRWSNDLLKHPESCEADRVCYSPPQHALRLVEQEANKRHQQAWFDEQVRMARRGLVWRDNEWREVDDVLPHGLTNRFG